MDSRGRRHTSVGPSIRFLSLVATIVFSGLTLSVAGLLICSSVLTQRALTSIVRNSREMAVAGDLKLQLLGYHRVRTLVALADDPAVPAMLTATQREMDALLERAYAAADDEAEQALVSRVDDALATYIEERERAAASVQPLNEQLRQVRPVLDRALLLLEALEQRNQVEVTRSHAAALRINRWSNMAGAAAGVLLLLGLMLALHGVRRFVLAPVLALRDTIDRYWRGNRALRAREAGPRELCEIAHAFNEMGAALENQRRNQLIFLAAVAHDLRNPLSAMRLGVRMLELEPDTPPPPERLQHTLRMLDRQLDLCTQMVTDLLDASRIEAGELELNKKDVDLREPAREVTQLYRSTSTIHDFLLEVPSDPVMVRADPLRIQQVVGNLVSNAVKYSPAGGTIRIVVGVSDQDALLKVTDEGLGMSKEEVALLFTPFRRYAPARQTIPGVGLGLSVVQRIVTAHGGHVDVQSQPGVGSTFCIRLPLARDEPQR